MWARLSGLEEMRVFAPDTALQRRSDGASEGWQEAVAG